VGGDTGSEDECPERQALGLVGPQRTKLIAEPWDVGQVDSYRVGRG
jgi:hypothetical protein